MKFSNIKSVLYLTTLISITVGCAKFQTKLLLNMFLQFNMIIKQLKNDNDNKNNKTTFKQCFLSVV